MSGKLLNYLNWQVLSPVGYCGSSQVVKCTFGYSGTTANNIKIPHHVIQFCCFLNQGVGCSVFSEDMKRGKPQVFGEGLL